MARTVWLTVFCLLGLGPFICAKVIMSTSMPTLAADVVDVAPPSAQTNVQQDALGKIDRFQTFQQTELKQAPIVSAAAVATGTVRPPLPDVSKSVGRHWHETSLLPAVSRGPTSRLGIQRRDTTAASGAKGKHCPDGNDMLETVIHITVCRRTLAASGNATSNQAPDRERSGSN